MKRFCVIGCIAWLPAPVCADGMFAGGIATEDMLGERVAGKSGVASTEQKGIIIQLPEGREALLLQTTYHGPADRFAWVVPVPGKPAKDDVFLASTEFIDALLDNTRPEVHTTIPDPLAHMRPILSPPPADFPGPVGSTMGQPQAVIVHERMEVGDYEANVLSATGAGVLIEWLTDNGYRIPDNSDDILEHYVGKSWYFVALKIRPGKGADGPVLEDVAPIGIRFDTNRLVYPLYISRASSRQKTALLLIVLSRGPVKCDQHPEAPLPLGQPLGKGACYAAIRKQAVDSAGPSMVSEYRGPLGMPYDDLYFEPGVWWGKEGPLWTAADLWTTRYWTLLDLDELVDLTFSPTDDDSATRLTISREGEIRSASRGIGVATHGRMLLYSIVGALTYLLSAWAARRGLRARPLAISLTTVGTAFVIVFLTAFGAAGALVLVAVVPIWVLSVLSGGRARAEADTGALSADDLIRGTLIAAGVGALGYAACLLATGGAQFLGHNLLGREIRLILRGEASAFWVLTVGVVQASWLVLVGGLMRRGIEGSGRKAAWIAVPFIGLLAVLTLSYGTQLAANIEGLASPLLDPDRPLLTVLTHLITAATGCTLLLLVSFVVVAPWLTDHARRAVQPMAHALAGLALVGALASAARHGAAHAGTAGYLRTNTYELDATLQALDGMLLRFRNSYGCYPAKLTDLRAATAPEQGVDSSGNPVRIATTPRDAANPLDSDSPTKRLPRDPLTARNDTWLYEPTGSPMVDSGGYEITIGRRELETRAPSEDDLLILGDALLDYGPQSYWRTYARLWLPLVDPRDQVFAGRVLDEDRVLRRFIRCAESLDLVLADVAAHAAAEAVPQYYVADLAWGPRRQRIAGAANEPRTAIVSSAGLHDEHGEDQLLLKGPWPAEVSGLDWHPREDKWLVVAHEFGREGTDKGGSSRGAPSSGAQRRPRVYLLGPDGVPRPVDNTDNALAARFTPDGEGILAVLAPEDSRGARDTTVLERGALWRLTPDGRRVTKLADSVAPWPLLVSGNDCVAVATGGLHDIGLIAIDETGTASRRLALPAEEGFVVDAWLGNGEIALALMSPDGRRTRQGDLWRCSLGSGDWRFVLPWAIRDPGRTRRLGELAIIGIDRSADACVVAHPEARAYGQVYAIRDGEPRIELLSTTWSENPDRRVDVMVEGEQLPVVVEGFFDPSFFQPGDLMAIEPGDDGFSEAAYVTGRSEDHLLVGDQKIAFGPDPSIDGETWLRCYAKFRQPEGHPPAE